MPMATAALIPVLEYLATTYRPDRDYIDGETKERNMGERPHSLLQMIFAAIFREHRKSWGTLALTEQRVQISPTRYRIADVCVVRTSDPIDPIVQVPPLLCIEVLSKGDTLTELQERVDDYQALGVQHVWAIDPWKRKAYIASVNGFTRPEHETFTIPGTPISISLSEVFAEFEESQTQS